MLSLKSKPIVDTRAGPVKGSFDALGRFASFRAIPYAERPVGQRRWKPPVQPAPWLEPLDCMVPGPIAHQRKSRYEIRAKLIDGLGLSITKRTVLKAGLRTRATTEDEDCLTLSVRTPAKANKAPVMVWIHGGDHTNGAGSDPIYDHQRSGFAWCCPGQYQLSTRPVWFLRPPRARRRD